MGDRGEVAKGPEVFLLDPSAVPGCGDAGAERPFQQPHPQRVHQTGPSSKSRIPGEEKVTSQWGRRVTGQNKSVSGSINITQEICDIKAISI